MKTAIQFGAGNIGRGFIGAVLSKSGYQVVFADVNKEIVDRINADGQYTVHIKDDESEDILSAGVVLTSQGGCIFPSGRGPEDLVRGARRFPGLLG